MKGLDGYMKASISHRTGEGIMNAMLFPNPPNNIRFPFHGHPRKVMLKIIDTGLVLGYIKNSDLELRIKKVNEKWQ